MMPIPHHSQVVFLTFLTNVSFAIFPPYGAIVPAGRQPFTQVKRSLPGVAAGPHNNDTPPSKNAGTLAMLELVVTPSALDEPQVLDTLVVTDRDRLVPTRLANLRETPTAALLRLGRLVLVLTLLLALGHVPLL